MWGCKPCFFLSFWIWLWCADVFFVVLDVCFLRVCYGVRSLVLGCFIVCVWLCFGVWDFCKLFSDGPSLEFVIM